jgi:hypothetical protein
MKEEVKKAIYAYFKSISEQGGKPVQAGNMLVHSVKSNLPYELKGYYDEAVQDLVADDFLAFRDEDAAVPGVTLGSRPGYRITANGVNRLVSY